MYALYLPSTDMCALYLPSTDMYALYLPSTDMCGIGSYKCDRILLLGTELCGIDAPQSSLCEYVLYCEWMLYLESEIHFYIIYIY